ncbi:MBL fold metallo-hydrolase [Falsiroseomonas tokyonensis]|uniref:MBL fold metallo-hydrolase n=1 Tax=Falsiroseomonas tokyonensis TaxID=430521 RepID=A0ABV7BUE7_9PROT|nr:MBL fold metallo-hydrolase [Falsiroseomonas tokyonensis]MBU8539135.1 MBL fold metallo-hydrolase [Falsiroseomonas tokyonensis]
MIDRRTLLAAGSAAALAPTLPALAQGAAVTPPFHHVMVGGLRATVVNDGAATRPDATQGFVVNAQPAQVAAALQAGGTPGPALVNPYNVTVVRTPRGLVLLDAGTGATPAMQVNMRNAGLDPAEVVLVAHTHFHGDHIGGLLAADGSPAFPNAQIAVPEVEWTFWMDPAEEARASEMRRPGFANARRRFAPYAGRITRFAPGAQVAPGITAVATSGHSPGHVSYLVADGDRQLMVIGDAITTPALFMANPEWYPVFDMDPTQAVATRKRLLDQLATDRIAVVGYHFPMPATGMVERAGSGYRLVPLA